MKTQTKPSKFKKLGPVLCLGLLSPIIAEVLFGSTPFTHFANLPLLIVFYGAGAIFIRELARRFHLGWLGIIALAIAFGITEEALALQTVFNPDYFGTDISYGRAWGVNWGWSLFIIGYHSLWSIALPIALTELIFRQKQPAPWLGKAGLVVSGVIFLLMTIFFHFIFQGESGYVAPAIGYGIANIAIAAFAAAAFLLPRTLRSNRQSVPRPLIIGSASALVSAVWLGLFSLLFEAGWGIPAVGLIAIGLVVITLSIFLLNRWNVAAWAPKQVFALAAGALITSTLFGFNVLLAANNPIDLTAQGVFAVLVGVFLVLLARRVYKTT